MCTLTWETEREGYQIFLNRDERRTRKPESPPAVRESGSTRFIAPLDGDFGGSWVAVNESGLTVCLLNGFKTASGTTDGRTDYTSRGLLLTSLVDARTTRSVAETLRARSLAAFRPFLLVAFENGGPCRLARWSGDTLRIETDEPDQPLVSSSFYSEEVRKNRTAVFAGLGALPPTRRHLAFHENHDPEAGPYSPCMHREDAHTVSFSWIRVDRTEAQFHYVPHAPCHGRPAGEPVRLRLNTASRHAHAPAGSRDTSSTSR